MTPPTPTDPGTTTRKRAAHLGPERRRPQLLDAALELFLEGGYEGTSMESVARAAGVTKPVVYAAFSSKDELFRSLLAREEERILEDIRVGFADADISDARASLINGLTSFFRAVAASPAVYRLIFMGEGGGNAAVAERIQHGRDAQAEALGALARTWRERNGARPGPALDAESRMLGTVLVAISEAGARLLLSGADGWTPESLGERLGEHAAASVA